jgi:hypothetical protein
MKNSHKILVENPKETDHLGNIVIGGRIILKCILKKWIGLIWLRIGYTGRLL